MRAPIVAFDLETVPDVAALRRLHGLEDKEVGAAEVVETATRLRRQEKYSDFLPLHLHRVVAVSCAVRTGEAFDVYSLQAEDGDEAALVRAFFETIAEHQPRLVSWNGGGFDLPVLHYRAMKHNIAAPAYWRADNDYRWNNYYNRYHERHTDLMDALSLYQGRSTASLNGLALVCGLPGKTGIGGAQVWPAFQRGEYDAIRRYCEADALLTYLLYLRFLLFRGQLDGEKLAAEEGGIRQFLRKKGGHWREFLDAWRGGGGGA